MQTVINKVLLPDTGASAFAKAAANIEPQAHQGILAGLEMSHGSLCRLRQEYERELIRTFPDL